MTAPVRDRLVTAAFALFAERGYEATTADDIAARAGVGRTTFFRTFRNKDEVVFPDHDRVLTALEARLATARPDTALVAAREGAHLVLAHYVDEGELARARYRLTSTVRALHDREVASIARYQRTVYEHLRRHLPLDRLRAELLAAGWVTAHNHVLRRWLRGDDTPPGPLLDAALDVALSAGRRGEIDGEPGAAVVLLRSAQDLEALLPRLRGLLGASG